jgi:hypothetical protein
MTHMHVSHVSATARRRAVLQEIAGQEGAREAGAQIKCVVRISFLQIYANDIRDLLVPDGKPLALRCPADEVQVLGLTEHCVLNGAPFRECRECVHACAGVRMTARR